ncbi:hypothetical protein JOM56_005462 [Amanita muscaria]
MPFNTLASLILISVANGIAVTSTCLRLVHRTVKQRLWWDEFWALVSLVFVICQWVASVDIPESGSPSARLWRVSYQVLYNFSLWTARISLAVTIVRICPQGRMRTVAKGVAGVFGACCVALTVRRTAACAMLDGLDPSCPFDTPAAAVETAFDVLADAWLICAPIYMVCRMRLPSRHLRMLVAIFTLNILTTIACSLHAAFRQLRMVPQAIITANIQSATSLFVCNLLVLVTFLYRRVRGGDEATSISDITESVTHSAPQQSNRPARSLQHRLPPGARIEISNVSASTCSDCTMCKYLRERLRAPLPRWRTTRSPLPRNNSKAALGKDPGGRAPSEKSFNPLFPCLCNLSPTSTFPDLPECQLHKDRVREPRRVPSEKSMSSLYPCPCHLSPSSTFPDLPVCPKHCHRCERREKDSSDRIPSSSLPSHLSPSLSTCPADSGHGVSPAVRSVTTQSRSQSTTDSGNNGQGLTDCQLDPPERTEPSEPLESPTDPPPECSSKQCIC